MTVINKALAAYLLALYLSVAPSLLLPPVIASIIALHLGIAASYFIVWLYLFGQGK